MNMRRHIRIGEKVSSDILALSNWRCFYCKAPFTQSNHPTIDHVIPVYQGGTDELKNLVAACSKCNNAKGAKSVTSMFPTKEKFIDAVSEYLGLTKNEVKLLRTFRKMKKRWMAIKSIWKK